VGYNRKNNFSSQSLDSTYVTSNQKFNFPIADKPGVACFGSTLALSKDLRLQLAGRFATKSNIESSNRFEVGPIPVRCRSAVESYP
jgi:hypothetical protein